MFYSKNAKNKKILGDPGVRVGFPTKIWNASPKRLLINKLNI